LAVSGTASVSLDAAEAVVVEVVVGVLAEERLVQQRLLVVEPLEQGAVDRGPAAGQPAPVHDEDEPCASALAVGLQQPVDERVEVVVGPLLVLPEVDDDGPDVPLGEVVGDEPAATVRLKRRAAVPGDVLPDRPEGPQPLPQRLPPGGPELLGALGRRDAVAARR
jgi:hypothetical protein